MIELIENVRYAGPKYQAQIRIDKLRVSLRKRTKCLKCLPLSKRKFLTDTERKERNAAKSANYYAENKDRLNANSAERSKQRRLSAKGELVALTGGCQICGRNDVLSNITYHHLRDKKYSVSSNEFQYQRKIVAEELFKCVSLCHNCHFAHHANPIDEKKMKLMNERFVELVKFWAGLK